MHEYKSVQVINKSLKKEQFLSVYERLCDKLEVGILSETENTIKSVFL